MAKDEQEHVEDQPIALDEQEDDSVVEKPLEIPSVIEDDSSEDDAPREVVDASEYKCFSCGKVIGKEYVRKRVRCPYCGSKIIFKARTKPNTVLSR